jgi:putative FmdB family regulatory protein
VPLYDYRCLACHKIVEKIVSFYDINNSNDEFQCPNPDCEELAFMERLFSGKVSVAYKASDFHVNTYNQHSRITGDV